MKIWYCHSNRDGCIFNFLTYQSGLNFEKREQSFNRTKRYGTFILIVL